MAGGKKKIKGLTPAKRKEAAKQSLQGRLKFDSDIKELLQTIEVTEKQRIAIQEERKELVEWADERANLRKYCEHHEKCNNEYICISEPGIKDRQCTIGKVRKDVDLLHSFMEHVNDQKYILKFCSSRWYNGFAAMFNQYKTTHDKLELLQRRNSGQNNKDILKERKERLEKQIKDLQLIYTNMSKLDQTRQEKHNDISLEEYMEKKMKVVHRNIRSLKEKVTVANEALTNVNIMVTNRQEKVQRLKSAIKEKTTASVEESQEYKRVFQANQKLLTQLDQLTRERDRITNDTRTAREEITKEEQRKLELTDEETDTKQAINELENQCQTLTARQPLDQQITEELRQQIRSRDVSLAHLQHATKQLQESVNSERQTVTMLRNEVDEVNKHNQSMLEKITITSNDMVTAAMTKCLF